MKEWKEKVLGNHRCQSTATSLLWFKPTWQGEKDNMAWGHCMWLQSTHNSTTVGKASLSSSFSNQVWSWPQFMSLSSSPSSLERRAGQVSDQSYASDVILPYRSGVTRAAWVVSDISLCVTSCPAWRPGCVFSSSATNTRQNRLLSCHLQPQLPYS